MVVTLFLQTGVANSGQAFGWIGVLMAFPVLILLPILFIIGTIVDKKQN